MNLWRYGQWETVIVDDRLPQKRNGYVYARCSDPDEFWVALIEKAFAKLHGCYEAIEGGMPIESMVDLTGGLAERYELNDPKMHPTLYKYDIALQFNQMLFHYLRNLKKEFSCDVTKYITFHTISFQI